MSGLLISIVYVVVAFGLSVPFSMPLDQSVIPSLPPQPGMTGFEAQRIAAHLQQFIWGIPVWKQCFIAAWFVWFGAVGYTLRCRQRLVYGILELIAAFLLVLGAISDLSSSTPNFLASGLALLSCIYVLVRGLDNVQVGLQTTWPGANANWNWFFAGR